MSSQLPEATHLFWYCRNCRKSCRVQPPTEQPACRCKNPVPGLHPTQVTVADHPKTRPLHALSDEEARIRALAREGTKVRVTFEAEVAAAIQRSGGGRRGLEFDVTTADGRRYTVDPDMPGLHIEAAPTDT